MSRDERIFVATSPNRGSDTGGPGAKRHSFAEARPKRAAESRPARKGCGRETSRPTTLDGRATAHGRGPSAAEIVRDSFRVKRLAPAPPWKVTLRKCSCSPLPRSRSRRRLKGNAAVVGIGTQRPFFLRRHARKDCATGCNFAERTPPPLEKHAIPVQSL
ncbi:hypothetical protein HPB50_024968 [Hyalomma asiaticum]|uniref:Uncharacterized protein n=1 Tax=Hyalomma asiaticum TaxID=266040 RepID=A0ACB7TQY0_HYAAI|nr:hypothetical protein HPB50_024968 [Hyalomma asiaticum]